MCSRKSAVGDHHAIFYKPNSQHIRLGDVMTQCDPDLPLDTVREPCCWQRQQTHPDESENIVLLFVSNQNRSHKIAFLITISQFSSHFLYNYYYFWPCLCNWFSNMIHAYYLQLLRFAYLQAIRVHFWATSWYRATSTSRPTGSAFIPEYLALRNR